MALSSEQLTQLQQQRPDVFQNKYYANNPEEWVNKYGAKEGFSFGGAAPATNKYAQIDALKNAYAGSLTSSPEEQDAYSQLQNLINSRELGLADIEDTNKNPVAMSFIQGQQERLSKQASLKALPLETRLAALQAKRQSAMDVNKFLYESEYGKLRDEEEDRRYAQDFAENVRQFNKSYKQSKKSADRSYKLSKKQLKASSGKYDTDYLRELEKMEKQHRYNVNLKNTPGAKTNSDWE